uniref:UBX domain-containing protein n=1 Tax=Globodera pallida TaxID=36090 RepID=A0A183C4A9_GLOPA
MTAEVKPASWIPLESNPEAFNKYVEIMGVKGVECHELLGFEPELIDFVPGPHLALIFCYPYQAKANAFLKNIYGQLAESGYVKPKWAFFMQQNIRNACGTFALFHSLLNNLKRIDIGDSEFGEWFGLSKQDGVEGSDLLANNSKLAALHEHCALNEAETNVPDKVDYHFISYGAQHAPFFQGSLLEAITEAFDSPGGGVEQRRPLAIYLHNDSAVAAHIFAQTVMSNVNVSNLLKCQFVLWAWDASLHDNKQSFFEWMDLANIGTIGNGIKMIPSSKYPLLIVLIKERGVIARADCIYGQDTAVMTTQKLIEALDQFQNIKQVDAEQERSRAERELFRREQSEEYHRGLAADKAKQEEQKRRKQLEQEEAEKRAQDEQNKQEHLNCLAKMLSTEPSVEDPQAITIRLRFPDGRTNERRFRDCENVEMLLVYAATLGYESDRYRIWTSDMPRKEIATLNVSKSFAQLNWTKRELLNVEEK